jgi:hypothetical protein
MTINQLIKKAINDPSLRSHLLLDSMKTCSQFGIAVEAATVDPSTLKPRRDPSIMQGGYRP